MFLQTHRFVANALIFFHSLPTTIPQMGTFVYSILIVLKIFLVPTECLGSFFDKPGVEAAIIVTGRVTTLQEIIRDRLRHTYVFATYADTNLNVNLEAFSRLSYSSVYIKRGLEFAYENNLVNYSLDMANSRFSHHKCWILLFFKIHHLPKIVTCIPQPISRYIVVLISSHLDNELLGKLRWLRDFGVLMHIFEARKRIFKFNTKQLLITRLFSDYLINHKNEKLAITTGRCFKLTLILLLVMVQLCSK